MAGGTARIHVDAPPERVYDLVSDVTRMAEWSPETYRAEWLARATGPVGRGRLTTWTYRMNPAPGGGTELEESWTERRSLLGRLLPRPRKDQLRRGMEATLLRIKAAAEAA